MPVFKSYIFFFYIFKMNEDGKLIIVNQDRKMDVSPPTLESGNDVTVSWDMPKDEASSKDWIGMRI